MGVITLTDRISVTVREKSSSGGTGGGGGGTAGGRDTASRLAETLGSKEDLTDEELDSIAEAIDNAGGKSGTDSSGARTGRSIVDEQNREWLPIESVIAAGKRMNDAGAFMETHHSFGNVASVDVSSVGPASRYGFGWNCKEDAFMVNETMGIIPGHQYDDEGKEPKDAGYGYGGKNFYYSGGVYVGIVHNKNTDTYNVVYSERVATLGGTITYGQLISCGVPVTEVGQTLLSLTAYGDHHEEQVNNPKIDWTAPNAEIERQLKQHYETFDPTDHDEGDDGMWAGGYVLAGPLTALN